MQRTLLHPHATVLVPVYGSLEMYLLRLFAVLDGLSPLTPDRATRLAVEFVSFFGPFDPARSFLLAPPPPSSSPKCIDPRRGIPGPLFSYEVLYLRGALSTIFPQQPSMSIPWYLLWAGLSPGASWALP